ncbi:MAG: hypothetical protein QOE65_2360 [Solirubrobacteraceae bacterium]|jgi:hypothetical protein|nr:hypothetical protein [Solirubrobacteraceae bacterium]
MAWVQYGQLRNVYEHILRPHLAEAVPGAQYQLVDQGDVIAAYDTGVIRAPKDGWGVYQWLEAPSGTGCASQSAPPPGQVPQGTEDLTVAVGCTVYSQAEQKWVYTPGAGQLHAGFLPVEYYATSSTTLADPWPSTLRNRGTVADPGFAAVRDAVAEELRQNEPDYPTLAPAVGCELLPECQPEEDPVPVPAPPRQEDNDEPCRSADAPVRGTLLPDAPPGYSGPDARTIVKGTFVDVLNPLAHAAQTVYLYYGTIDWGYKHIVERHGYGPSDAVSTAEALQTPHAVTPDSDDDTSSLFYRYFTGRDGSACTRRVVVQWSAAKHPGFRIDGEDVPYHVITSFAYKRKASDPVEGTGL